LSYVMNVKYNSSYLRQAVITLIGVTVTKFWLVNIWLPCASTFPEIMLLTL
jgi:hypothetical protein